MADQKKEKTVLQEIVGLWPIVAFLYIMMSLPQQIKAGQWPILTAVWDSGFIQAVLWLAQCAVILLFVLLAVSVSVTILIAIFRRIFKLATKR